MQFFLAARSALAKAGLVSVTAARAARANRGFIGSSCLRVGWGKWQANGKPGVKTVLKCNRFVASTTILEAGTLTCLDAAPENSDFRAYAGQLGNTLRRRILHWRCTRENKMALMILGLALIALKALGLAPVSGWDWWLVIAPLALAPLWWWFSDLSGRTRRLEEQRHEARRQARRRSTIASLGRRH
ncbi:TIGR04438 family Trp-rich protein [Sphaerotilus sulfidivorans]|uniref:TIGR04438 family Trp-rich protein n=2 Tax=Sphaerotilus sulfidivorans TaxID=639200 RepID=A0A5C1Q164_9BURK|nr:TIGR04438 family Trp-rich protein [Sphaerotilus sulfidivorans]